MIAMSSYGLAGGAYVRGRIVVLLCGCSCSGVDVLKREMTNPIALSLCFSASSGNMTYYPE
eukprot:5810971-Amphidinium_carterae.1